MTNRQRAERVSRAHGNAFTRKVGQAIRDLRISRGLTLDAATSQTVGLVSLNLWSNYENGHTDPKISKLIAIAAALAVPVVDLLPEPLAEMCQTGKYDYNHMRAALPPTKDV